MNQRWGAAATIAGAVAAAGAVWLACSSVPLGWPGEWVWNRARPPGAAACFPAAAALALYIAFAAWGRARIERGGRTAARFAALLCAGAAVQALALDVPNAGYGIERWPLALHGKASSGYLARAREIADERLPLDRFLGGYLEWVRGQDNFHMGTHPPGLFLVSMGARRWAERWPDAAGRLIAACPARFQAGLAALPPATRPADRGALAALALGTWIAVLLTAAPVWLLARWRGTPELAWSAAATWLLTPGPLLFLPLGDCLYPLLAALWVWLALVAADRRNRFAAAGIGAAAAFVWLAGMLCSAAFLATLPIAGGAALAARCGPGAEPRRWRWAVGGFLAGAAALLAWLKFGAGLDLLAIWRENLVKHAGFYRHFPRTYSIWVWLDLLEFAVVAGPALCVALAARAFRPAAAPLAAATAATLLALDFAGKNLSEVARLWLFLLPFVAAGAMPPGRRSWLILLAGEAVLMLALLAHVEPLLPVPPP